MVVVADEAVKPVHKESSGSEGWCEDVRPGYMTAWPG